MAVEISVDHRSNRVGMLSVSRPAPLPDAICGLTAPVLHGAAAGDRRLDQVMRDGRHDLDGLRVLPSVELTDGVETADRAREGARRTGILCPLRRLTASVRSVPSEP